MQCQHTHRSGLHELAVWLLVYRGFHKVDSLKAWSAVSFTIRPQQTASRSNTVEKKTENVWCQHTNKSSDSHTLTHTVIAYIARTHILHQLRMISIWWSARTCYATAFVPWLPQSRELERLMDGVIQTWYVSSSKRWEQKNKKLKCGVPAHQHTNQHALTLHAYATSTHA